MNIKERLRKSLYFLIMAILLVLLVTFMFRSPFASWFLKRQVARFNTEHGADLKIGGVRILGLASIRITGITLCPVGGDTLVKIDTAYASVGIVKLFAGRLSIHDVELKNSWFSLKKQDNRTNYMFLVHGRSATEDTLTRPTDYGASSEKLLRFVFDKVPRSLSIENFNLSHTDNDHVVSFHMDDFVIRDHFFRSEIEVQEDSLHQDWILAGRIDNGRRLAEFRLYPADTMPVRLPFVERKWQAGLVFDTLSFGFSEEETKEAGVRIGGFGQVRGLKIDHRMVAARPIKFDKLGIDFTINIGKDYFEIDSLSSVTFNRIDFHPYLKYRPVPSKQITLKINKPPFAAMDLFSSFPEGLFTSLDGITVRGNLSWYLDFYVDLNQPDSLRFETALNRHQFGVVNYGNTELTKLNEPFSYTAWEHDQPVATFIVGPENPDFRRLDQISHFLQTAVMTAEDGSFYLHRGFLPEAFVESMITNIKERRFARGGSTISMQLVKNVFLSRNKTIARKMEEAMIVWLIENQGISTKDRMFEVYLNIIEWGPMIYGAQEASRFYFAKDVSRLTLAEAIFMASIIPRPKWFRYSYDENGHLRESNAGFYRQVSEKMLGKGWISEADAANLVPDVELKGPAKLLLKKQVPESQDSTIQIDGSGF